MHSDANVRTSHD